MHIESGPHARNEAGGEMGFHAGKVLGPGDLDIGLAPRHQGHGQAGGFQHGGIIGRRAIAGAMSGPQCVESEGLRRLGAEQPVTRNGLDDQATGAAFQRVGNRLGGDGAGSIGQRVAQGADGARGDDRPGRIMDQDDVGRIGGEGIESRAHAVRPRLAPGDGRQDGQPVEQRGDARFITGGDNRQDAAHQPFPQQGLRRVAQHGTAQQWQVLLRHRRADARAGAGGHQQGIHGHLRLRPRKGAGA